MINKLKKNDFLYEGEVEELLEIVNDFLVEDKEAKKRSTLLDELTKEIKKMGKKDFAEVEGDLVDLINDLLDENEDFLVEDYPVKGHYSMRGKPPQRTWIRRHTREEGKTIKDKPRLASEHAQNIHAGNIREKRLKEIPIWLKLRRFRKRRSILHKKSEEMVLAGNTGIELSPIIKEIEELRLKIEEEGIPPKGRIKHQIGVMEQ